MTLVTTLFFLGGWVRSFTYGEVFYFPRGPHSFLGVASCNGSLGWAQCYLANASGMPAIPYWDVIPNADSLMNMTLFNMDGVKWRWQWRGFGVYEITHDEDSWMNCLQVPYWSIVIPLTIASSLLLLARPVSSRRAKTAAPLFENLAP